MWQARLAQVYRLNLGLLGHKWIRDKVQPLIHEPPPVGGKQ